MRIIHIRQETGNFYSSCLSTIYEFGSIQFSDTIMSDQCSDFFLKILNNQNVSKIPIDILPEMIISVPKTDR